MTTFITFVFHYVFLSLSFLLSFKASCQIITIAAMFSAVDRLKMLITQEIKWSGDQMFACSSEQFHPDECNLSPTVTAKSAWNSHESIPQRTISLGPDCGNKGAETGVAPLRGARNLVRLDCSLLFSFFLSFFGSFSLSTSQNAISSEMVSVIWEWFYF